MVNKEYNKNQPDNFGTAYKPSSHNRVSNSRFSSVVNGAGLVGSLQSECVSRLFDRWLLRAHPPARLKAADAADLLGFHEDDMAVLVREGFISPLGNPKHNAVKYFSLSDVEALGRDPQALSAATEVIYDRNRLKSAVDSCHAAMSTFMVVKCIARSV